MKDLILSNIIKYKDFEEFSKYKNMDKEEFKKMKQMVLL